METIVTVVSIVFPAFVLIIIGIGARKILYNRKEERTKHDREKLIMKRVIEKKNEIISRMDELIEQ